jgi:hypothetical protein
VKNRISSKLVLLGYHFGKGDNIPACGYDESFLSGDFVEQWHRFVSNFRPLLLSRFDPALVWIEAFGYAGGIALRG